ncbi:MAG: DUF362 domain-containing protein [Christensenellaceae bacterium]|jgi:uncharacterized Fe-S center protein|nr:DUF362 domain-containing protein [Christensenellaceae bacterium]
MSKVLFAPMGFSRYDIDQTLPSRFERLLQKSELGDMVQGKTVAIKIHVGDRMTFSTIPPVFLRILVNFVQAHGGDCFICDHAIAERQPENRGYTQSTLGCPVLDDCGHLNKYYYTKQVELRTLQHVDIAGYIHDADVLIDFSHVKGHGACGYGGACKNIAMGCVSTRTRQEEHGLEGGLEWDADKCVRCNACIEGCNHHANSFNSQGEYEVFYHDCTLCQHCLKVCPTGAIRAIGHNYTEFQQGLALCTKTVLDTFAPGHVFYINLLAQITILCDCWGFTTPSLVPDIGIMASSDIVAIEQASLDAIKYENLIPVGLPKGHVLGDTGHLFERIHGKDPFVQIAMLEKYGLGSHEYALEEVE